MKPRRWWWSIYGAVSAIVLLAVLIITVMVQRLERAELAARVEFDYQEAVRSALWRMDSWLVPRLAREAARPFYDYMPFHPQPLAYTKELRRVQPNEVITPSPLLLFQSDYFELHFQMDDAGTMTSPQVPRGDLRELAVKDYLSTAQIHDNEGTLQYVRQLLSSADLEACVAEAESQVLAQIEAGQPGNAASQTQQQRNQQEWAARFEAYVHSSDQYAQTELPPELHREVEVIVSPLVPLWTNLGAGEGELVFVRRVRLSDAQYVQGFLCNWPNMKAALSRQIADLFPEAGLTPVANVPPGEMRPANMLAMAPVALEVTSPATPQLSLLSPVRLTLAFTWLAVVAGIAAVAMTLQATIAFAEKRSRFASAVTHELRTPLTTFCMYTEMLAEGMVPDEQRRREYLTTLKEESSRLSTLVENVLSYARLEDGRLTAQARRSTIEELIGRLVPTLRRRAEDASMQLEVATDAPQGTTLTTDAGAVGQILFNLVDNACKYTPRDSGDRTIHLQVHMENGSVLLDVQDPGPGIPPGRAKAIFTPFERCGHDNGQTPGIGLGLALSRGLARDLGGDLELAESTRGARFRLRLPVGDSAQSP